MKTHREADRIVTTHNVSNTTAFKIRATGKAFKILIDGLYSDKILAVIRELWSNAYDAHAAAGNEETPFDCHLPTQFEPTFSVRDYGCGMDDELIMNLYTEVFGSSKEDTNTQVGKLGLGSKSPFAYVDTFTVTAWDGETKRMYSVFIDANDIPTIAKMDTQASSEPRGVEISFPVEVDDYYKFRETAHQVGKGFLVKPNMTGEKIQWLDENVVASGEGWKLYSGRNGSEARQGCVLYPINAYAINGLSDDERDFLGAGLEIDFPIGDLEISASREMLGYTLETQRNIALQTRRIIKELSVTFQQELESKKTLWEARTYLKDLADHAWDADVISALIDKLTWRGKKIDKDLRLQNMRIPDGKTFQNGGVNVMLVDSGVLQYRTYGRQRALKFSHSAWGNVDPSKTLVVVEDASARISQPPVRIKKWWNSLPNAQRKSVLWIKCNLKTSALKRMLVQLGRPDRVYYLTDMERSVTPRGQGTRTRTKMKLFNKGSWEDTTVTEEDANIYVYMDRKYVVGPDLASDPEYEVTNPQLHIAINCLVELGYLKENTPIIGVPQTHKRVPVRNSGTWTCLWDIAKKAIDDKFDLDICAQSLCARKAFNTIDKNLNFMRQIYKQELKGTFYPNFRPTATAGKAYTFWKEIVAKSDAGKAMASALDLYLVMNDKIESEIDVSKYYIKLSVFSDLGKDYPLISANLNHWDSWSPTLVNCVQYINLVDAAMEDKYSLLMTQLTEDDEEIAA